MQLRRILSLVCFNFRHGNACEYIICWWFFISHLWWMFMWACTFFSSSFPSARLLLWCFGNQTLPLSFLHLLPFYFKNVQMCASFCMFHDHVCVFLFKYLCALFVQFGLLKCCMLSCLLLEHIITMCFRSEFISALYSLHLWVMFSLVALIMAFCIQNTYY